MKYPVRPLRLSHQPRLKLMINLCNSYKSISSIPVSSSGTTIRSFPVVLHFAYYVGEAFLSSTTFIFPRYHSRHQCWKLPHTPFVIPQSLHPLSRPLKILSNLVMMVEAEQWWHRVLNISLCSFIYVKQHLINTLKWAKHLPFLEFNKPLFRQRITLRKLIALLTKLV